MKYLLGIDFGGGASKATLIDEMGNIVAESTAEYPTLYPEQGACEQSPDDWIAALCKNTSELLEKSGINPADILCIAADSATHTFLPCDNNFVPLMNAVHWTDTRSRAEANALKSENGEEIFKKTFHKPDTIWTLPQLLWLKNSRPEIFSKIGHIFFEKDYIRYFLTGVFCTDYIEAQGVGGTVKEVQMFHTVLGTVDNKVIYIPNGSLSSGVVTNFSNQTTRRVDWTFGVEYGSDYEKVKQVIESVLAKDSRILSEPAAPFIALTALADSSVNVVVRVWVNSSDYWGVYFDINKNIYATFNEVGIGFPFPQLTVHQAKD